MIEQCTYLALSPILQRILRITTNDSFLMVPYTILMLFFQQVMLETYSKHLLISPLKIILYSLDTIRGFTKSSISIYMKSFWHFSHFFKYYTIIWGVTFQIPLELLDPNSKIFLSILVRWLYYYTGIAVHLDVERSTIPTTISPTQCSKSSSMSPQNRFNIIF